MQRATLPIAMLSMVVLMTGCAKATTGGSQPTSIALTGLGQSAATPLPGAAHAANCGAPITYTVFQHNAFASVWSKADNVIAFNKKSADGLYHLYTARPDGSDVQQIGRHSPSFPQRTTGSPSLDPSGRYIAFVAEKTTHPGNSDGATPGWGGYSDLWVSTADGSRAWQLTNVPVDPDHGTLIPQFSPDGTLLEWTERTQAPNVLNPIQAAGFWVIKVAHFAVAADGTPSLSGIQTIDPGGPAFNETGGFSPDSKSLVFSSDFGTRNFWSNQIYTINLSSGAITRLTKGASYNEHPRYTPDGRVIWMSGEGRPKSSIGTDWWTMNADGTNQTRLSSFNDPSSPEYYGISSVWATVVQTESWSADGSYFFGDVETSLLTSDSDIVKVSLTCH